jgi:hypothetical protein
MENIEMADTLKDTANQALISLIQSVADAATFLKGEIPAAVQELLTYYTVSAIVQVVFATLVCAGTVYFWAMCNMKFAGERERVWFCRNWDLPAFFSLIPMVPGTIWLVGSILSLLKVTLAPRIWLLEYAAGLIK